VSVTGAPRLPMLLLVLSAALRRAGGCQATRRRQSDPHALQDMLPRLSQWGFGSSLPRATSAGIIVHCTALPSRYVTISSEPSPRERTHSTPSSVST
jgi:hypothetical protein